MAGFSEARVSEWLPIANAPPNEDLEICVMDYDGNRPSAEISMSQD